MTIANNFNLNFCFLLGFPWAIYIHHSKAAWRRHVFQNLSAADDDLLSDDDDDLLSTFHNLCAGDEHGF